MSGDGELDELKRDALQAAKRERKRKDAEAKAARSQMAGQRTAAQRQADAKARRKQRGVESADTWHRLEFPISHELAGLPWIVLVMGAIFTTPAVPGLYKLIPLGIVAVFLGLMLRSYLRFRSWRVALPYELKGWPALIEGVRPPTREMWQRITVAVTLPPRPAAPPPTAADGDAPYREVHALTADDDRADHVLAALMVFAERANREFYGTRNEDHKRSQWHASGTSASGSANASVLWRIHLLCRGPLALIARKRGSFVVELTAKGDPVHVSVPSSKKH